MNTASLVPSLAVALVAACASTAPSRPPPAPPPPAPVVAAPEPAVDAGPPAAPAPVFSIRAPLPAGHGIVMAERPGDTIVLHPTTGADVTLVDGESVTFVDDDASVGGGDATATIEAHGVRGVVPNARVVTEDRLRRAPTGTSAIFTAIFSCGDYCHGEVWLLGPEGERTRITQDAGPSTVVAWRADGARVVVGSYGLWVVDVAGPHVTSLPGFSAPVYAPDGALFVRGTSTDDGVFLLADGAPPRRLFGAPGRPPRQSEANPDADPSPVTIEADGSLRASFVRGARSVTARGRRP